MPSIEELESQAAEFSQRGDVQATERVCREILKLDKQHLSSLNFLANLAMQAGDFASAESRLQALLALSPGDPSLHSRLGQAYYHQGKLQEALAAYEDCWRNDHRKSLLYLTLGCLHLELGNVDKAAQVFSLGEVIDGNLLALWKKPDTNPAVARMSKQGWQTLCQHNTDLHIRTVEALGDTAGCARIRDALWPVVDTRPVSYDHPKHQPQVFSVNYDESPAFFATSDLPWCKQLEGQFESIREEVLAGLDVAADGAPYLQDKHRLHGEQWQPLVNKKNWAAVHLYSGGVVNQRMIDKFPLTMAALSEVSLVTTSGVPSEAFVSVLAPHTHIPEHFGVSNAILTVHLPIEVPPDCGLKVHDEVRTPRAGELLVFDDTWEHSAWNNSDQPRVVLIFEVWNPQLTELEREAILRSFEARQEWLKQRTVA